MLKPQCLYYQQNETKKIVFNYSHLIILIYKYIHTHTFFLRKINLIFLFFLQDIYIYTHTLI